MVANIMNTKIIKNRTFPNSGIELMRADMSFFIPGRALMVLRGLNILIILKAFSFTVPTDRSRILQAV